MPAESNITDLFRSAKPAPSSSIDVQEVIRRSRRRRLPKQLGAGSVFSLAAVGIGVAGISGLGGAGSLGGSVDQATTLESAGSSPESESMIGGSALDSGELNRAPAEQLNLCGAEVAQVEPSQTGLELTVDFPDAAASAEQVTGVVTLTNNGTERMTGYTAPLPSITLAKDGIVVWHSNGPTIMSVTDVDLAPGETLQYEAFFSPVVCSAEDDLEGFRDDLPAAPAGQYEVFAALDFMSDGPAELITGPADTVTLK